MKKLFEVEIGIHFDKKFFVVSKTAKLAKERALREFANFTISDKTLFDLDIQEIDKTNAVLYSHCSTPLIGDYFVDKTGKILYTKDEIFEYLMSNMPNE